MGIYGKGWMKEKFLMYIYITRNLKSKSNITLCNCVYPWHQLDALSQPIQETFFIRNRKTENNIFTHFAKRPAASKKARWDYQQYQREHYPSFYQFCLYSLATRSKVFKLQRMDPTVPRQGHNISLLIWQAYMGTSLTQSVWLCCYFCCWILFSNGSIPFCFSSWPL